MRETVLLCKPYPMQRLLVLCILTLARRMQGNDGLSLPATVGVDKLPHTTEPGLSVWSFKRGLRLSFFVPENLVHHFFQKLLLIIRSTPLLLHVLPFLGKLQEYPQKNGHRDKCDFDHYFNWFLFHCDHLRCYSEQFKATPHKDRLTALQRNLCAVLS